MNCFKLMQTKITSMKYIGFTIIALSVFLFSCTSTLEKKYSKESTNDDMKELAENIDSNDFQLILGTMLRYSMNEKNLEGMTYKEVLLDGKEYVAEQKRIEEEQKALAEKAKKEEEERIKKLNDVIVVTCFEKGFTKVKYDSYITFKFALKNKSDQGIRAVKGTILFTNLFDDEVKGISFVYDKPIATNSEVTWEAQSEYNQFIDSDKDLRTKDLKDLKVIWTPEKVIFEDGSTLE